VQIVAAVVATDTDGVTVAVIVTNKLPVMLLVHQKLYLAAGLLVPLVAWMCFASYLSYSSIP
jgi:tryptophan-rich sensory protein